MLGALLIALVASSTGLKPSFDTPYQNVTRESGKLQFVKCQVDEEDKDTTYKWYNLDGDEVTEDGQNSSLYNWISMLTFNKMSREHEGLYTCLASNENGLARKDFYVRVVPNQSGIKPNFDLLFENVTVENGTYRLLTCEVSEGEKPVTYNWYNQDGDEITEDQQKPFYVRNSKLFSYLFFKNISTEHEGSYTCKVSNANGQATKVFNLRVVPSPIGLKPEFEIPYEKVTREPGRSASIKCQADEEYNLALTRNLHFDTHITYKWYNQDEDEITQDRKKPVHVTNRNDATSHLHFKRLTREHEGSYTCTASNKYGLTSKVFFLTVPPLSGLKPAFDFPFQNVTREPGRLQLLQCQAHEGEKPVTYKWYNQDGDEITDDRKNPFYVTNEELYSVLYFKKLRSDHEGAYTCTASNINGQASSVFFLSVPTSSGA